MGWNELISWVITSVYISKISLKQLKQKKRFSCVNGAESVPSSFFPLYASKISFHVTLVFIVAASKFVIAEHIKSNRETK